MLQDGQKRAKPQAVGTKERVWQRRRNLIGPGVWDLMGEEGTLATGNDLSTVDAPDV